VPQYCWVLIVPALTSLGKGRQTYGSPPMLKALYCKRHCMKTYHLFKNKECENHLIIIHDRAQVTNSIEQSIDTAIEAEISTVMRCASRNLDHPIKVGSMEDFPIGDQLFECGNGDIIDIWYSHNTLNNNYLILGAVSTIEEFHDEANDEYKGMVGPITTHKQVTAVVLNAI